MGRAFWFACLAAGAVAAIVLLVAARAKPAPVAPPVARGKSPGLPRPAPAVDPDSLAREGRYGEAIHALLLVALAQIAARSRLAPALTAREVLSAPAVTLAQRSALEPLVVAAERVHFAAQPASAEDYQRCCGQARALGLAR